MSLKEQARKAKIMSPWGKLTAKVCHLNKNVNKAEEQTYLTINILCGHKVKAAVFT
jgi:hypothetical protein